ncbi:MAG: exosortase A [Candidatus Tectomicrobia bacterium]
MVTVLERPKRQVDAFPKVDQPPRARQRGILPCFLLAVPFFYLYASVLSGLVADWWNDPDYSHGFLVPLLSAYFLWEKRQRLANIVPQSNRWGMVVLVVGLCQLFLGHIGAELFLMRFSIIVVIAGLVLYLFGWQHLRELRFSIGFLLFMIPLPAILLNSVTFPLQLFAAKLSTFSLQLIDLPVYREGNIIFLPHVTLEIVEACSGLRSLVSLMALATVFAYLTQRHIWKLCVLVSSAVPIALVANAFRIWGTGILSHHYGTKAAEGFYHTFAGWSVFVVAGVLLLIVGLVLSRLGVEHAHSKDMRR